MSAVRGRGSYLNGNNLEVQGPPGELQDVAGTIEGDKRLFPPAQLTLAERREGSIALALPGTRWAKCARPSSRRRTCGFHCGFSLGDVHEGKQGSYGRQHCAPARMREMSKGRNMSMTHQRIESRKSLLWFQ